MTAEQLTRLLMDNGCSGQARDGCNGDIGANVYGEGAGYPPDGSGAEGGGGAGGDVRVVLGVQLVVDGVLRAESPEVGGGSARSRAQPGPQSPSAALCPGGLVQLGLGSFAYICIALLLGTIGLCCHNRVHWRGEGMVRGCCGAGAVQGGLQHWGMGLGSP